MKKNHHLKTALKRLDQFHGQNDISELFTMITEEITIWSSSVWHNELLIFKVLLIGLYFPNENPTAYIASFVQGRRLLIKQIFFYMHVNMHYTMIVCWPIQTSFKICNKMLFLWMASHLVFTEILIIHTEFTNKSSFSITDRKMSSARLSVQWLFGDVINSSRFMDLKKLK